MERGSRDTWGEGSVGFAFIDAVTASLVTLKLIIRQPIDQCAPTGRTLWAVIII
jgi:hypothetical protein